MAIAVALRDYLDCSGIRYGVVGHPYSITSMQTERATHIHGKQLAKAVVLQDDEHYVVVEHCQQTNVSNWVRCDVGINVF